MRKLILAILILGISTYAKTKPQPPFASRIESSTDATVLLENSTAQSQYLGFNWIDTYCFGSFIGCAVTNRPAEVDSIYRFAVVETGPWLLYLHCTVQYMSLTSCGEIRGAIAEIKIRKNGKSVDVRNASLWRTVYTISAAYNTTTKEIWGDGGSDDWRAIIAVISIKDTLKNMAPQQQVYWIGILQAMQADNLINADSLEKVLRQMSAQSQ